LGFFPCISNISGFQSDGIVCLEAIKHSIIRYIFSSK